MKFAWLVLKSAIQKVPILKYVLGVAGLAAAASIMKSFPNSGGKIIVKELSIIFIFMILLVAISYLGIKDKKYANLKYIIVAAILSLMTLTFVAIFTSVFFNFPKKISEVFNMGPDAYEFRIKLSGKLRLGPEYPTFFGDTLILELNSDDKVAQIEKSGRCRFSEIPDIYENQTLRIELKSKYWKLENDSLTLTDKHQTVWLTPNNVLGELSGKVTDSKRDKPISNAQVEIENTIYHTDSSGNFNANVSIENQKASYRVRVTKMGYDSWVGESTPETKQPISVLLNRSNK
jgi:hypothetical protein